MFSPYEVKDLMKMFPQIRVFNFPAKSGGVTFNGREYWIYHEYIALYHSRTALKYHQDNLEAARTAIKELRKDARRIERRLKRRGFAF